MERLGVISKVEALTQWCCGMVVVPKSNGAVRIRVDLKPLNESVLREPHPIPKVDDLLGLLTGANHFSKLDANSGFLPDSFCSPSGAQEMPNGSLLNVQRPKGVMNVAYGTVSTENEQDPRRVRGLCAHDG